MWERFARFEHEGRLRREIGLTMSGERDGGQRPKFWGKLFAAGALALFVALAVRAVDPDRWSDWSVGDALTLLTLRQWGEKGWVANRLLMLPQGYAAPIAHLDAPDLRQHAHGISPGSSPRVGPRLWYTHYPPGYLVPYALLSRLGLGAMAVARLLALTISFAALTLMYLVFMRIASAPVAFFAALFYALSPAFLGYADALANQPLDDLLRFGFMLAVVLSTRAAALRARRTALLVAWSLEFLLTLCSFDSVFFIFFWLIGWDLLEGRRFALKKYLAFGVAPVAGFGLLFAQNAWYLGWMDAARDIADTFLNRSAAVTNLPLIGSGGGDSIRRSLLAVLKHLYPQPWILLSLALLYGIRHLFFKDRRGGLPSPPALGLLLICGAVFEIVLPVTSWMPYEGRQMAPFVALLAGGLTVATVSEISVLRRRLHPALGETVFKRTGSLFVAVATLMLVGFWGVWGRNVYDSIGRISRFAIPSGDRSVLLAKDLRSLPTEHDAIFFDLAGFGRYLKHDPVPGYPQIYPILEYYVGSKPILAFRTEALLVNDLEKLARRSPREFSPVLASQDLSALRKIVIALGDRGLLTRMPEAPLQVRNTFVLDLTPVMNW